MWNGWNLNWQNCIKMWYKKYRIITDMYCGFSVQCWRIWFPFWLQIDFTNTFLSLEEAKEALELHKNHIIHYEE